MVAKGRRTDDPSGVPDIGQLINQDMQMTGRSLRGLERASDARLSHGRWGQIKLGQIREFPDLDTIRVIAEVLNVNHTDVVLGIAKALGLEVRAHGSPIPLPVGVERLSESQRRMVWQMVTTFLEGEETTGGPAESEIVARHGDAARKSAGVRKRSDG